ncbi:MAG TPA: TadE/TadG family type IV pilus assembly protein [Candidatus Limnocylindrales bacterium]|nr:TadE/TadG family type IV pilus assembly protein [Candidatus Limnocylindrales bacterium]
MTRVARRYRRSRGQSLVEFALVLPIFILLLFGLIDGGRLVYQHSVLSQAAREGARLASVEASWIGSADAGCGGTGGPVCPASAAAMKTDIITAANRMIAPFAAVTSAEVFVRCDPSGGTPTGNWTGSTCSSNATGNVASVRITGTFRPITPVISQLVGNVSMSASTSMVIN